MTRHTTPRGVASCLIGAILCAVTIVTDANAQIPRTRDMAELMPQDTLFYIGWADLMTEDEWRTQSQMMRSIMRFAARWAPDDPDFDVFEKLFRVAEPLARAPGGIGLFEMRMTESGPEVQIGAVIDAGTKSAELLSLVEQLPSVIDFTHADISVKGASLRQLAIPGTPLELLWGVHKGRFLICQGEAAAEKIIDRINGQGDSLADNDDLRFHRKKTNTHLSSLIAQVLRLRRRAADSHKGQGARDCVDGAAATDGRHAAGRAGHRLGPVQVDAPGRAGRRPAIYHLRPR